MIDADVTEVLTQLPATGISRHSDLMRQPDREENQSSWMVRGHLRSFYVHLQAALDVR